jgi:hypothetical protein
LTLQVGINQFTLTVQPINSDFVATTYLVDVIREPEDNSGGLSSSNAEIVRIRSNSGNLTATGEEKTYILTLRPGLTTFDFAVTTADRGATTVLQLDPVQDGSPSSSDQPLVLELQSGEASDPVPIPDAASFHFTVTVTAADQVTTNVLNIVAVQTPVTSVTSSSTGTVIVPPKSSTSAPKPSTSSPKPVSSTSAPKPVSSTGSTITQKSSTGVAQPINGQSSTGIDLNGLDDSAAARVMQSLMQLMMLLGMVVWPVLMML